VAHDERRAMIFEDATGTLEGVEIANEGGGGRGSVLVDEAGAVRLREAGRGVALETGKVGGKD
jgi:hypothetical protein